MLRETVKYDLTLSEHNAPSKLAGGVTNTAVFTRQVQVHKLAPLRVVPLKSGDYVYGGSKRNNQIS